RLELEVEDDPREAPLDLPVELRVPEPLPPDRPEEVAVEPVVVDEDRLQPRMEAGDLHPDAALGRAADRVPPRREGDLAGGLGDSFPVPHRLHAAVERPPGAVLDGPLDRRGR